MSARDKSTNTEPDPNIAGRRHFLGIKVKDLLQIISQLLLPLILAIFTIVVTFDQRSENRIQRIEDRRAAEGQREQDLNTSRELRENDRWIAEEQRKHDKQIAADKRVADDLNAEIQRNMTRDQRIYEINIEQERYKKEYETYLDNLLLSYYNEMGELLQKQNGISLVSHPVSFALARSKTLNTIEQVGPRRAARLIMFLYGAGQLTIGDKSLDLTEADLNNIDFRSQRNLGKIYLSAAYLNNASFDGQDLSYANFKNAQLSNATFKNSICVGTRFDGAQLIKADFTGANISGASFVKSNLQQASFYQASGDSPLFQYTRMQEANFSDCHFTFESIATNGFIDSNLAASDFRHANLQQSRFFYCNLTYADFANANLRRADMTGCDMSHAFFLNSDLGFTVLFSTNLSYANLSTIQCTGTYLNISACKLNQALTLANAHLPDRSFGLPLEPFFTVKDHPQCQRDVLG